MEARYKKLRDNIESFLGMVKERYNIHGKLLEVGAGTCSLGEKYFGALKTEKHEIDIEQWHDSRKWNAIFCIEVLEHLKDPEKAARNLHRALTPGGYLIVSVPFAYRSHYPRDYWRFTEMGLQTLFYNYETIDFYKEYFDKRDEADDLPLNLFCVCRK